MPLNLIHVPAARIIYRNKNTYSAQLLIIVLIRWRGPTSGVEALAGAWRWQSGSPGEGLNRSTTDVQGGCVSLISSATAPSVHIGDVLENYMFIVRDQEGKGFHIFLRYE